MSGRYWITGVQLGLLKVVPEGNEREKLIEEIINEQFITDCPTDEDKELFKKKIASLSKDSGSE